MAGPALALLGSGEFEPWAEEVDSWLLSRASTGDGSVLILPTASAPEGDLIFDAWAEKGLEHYRRQNIAAEVLALKTREDAHDAAAVERLRRASAVFVSGGNPAYLAKTLAETPFWHALRDAMRDGLAYAGCSAGAACLGKRAPNSNVTQLDSNTWRAGLGLFPSAYIGPHWDALDAYMPGLRDFFLASVPEGGRILTIDEATAILGDGKRWQVVGSGGAAFLMDGVWSEARSGQELTADLLA